MTELAPTVVSSSAALRVSDVRYQALFDYSPDGILIADRAGRYLDANPSICRMLGYEREELVRLASSDIVMPGEVEHIGRALLSISGPSGYQREWEFRRKDGSAFAADVIATLTPDGNVMAMVRDLSERNAGRETQRRIDEQTRFALDSAHVGIWDMDYATGVLGWSSHMEQQYGLAPGSFARTYDAFIAAVHPADRESLIATLENAMQTGGDFSAVHRVVWPDGEVHWLTVAGRVVVDDTGRPLRSVGISQDISARQRLEAQFQQAQKMEAVGQLAAGVAHDFNNLLTVMLGFCELLLAGPQLEETQREDIGEVQKAGMRATELTRQLLAFSRKQIIEPTCLDVNAILADMQPMLARLIREDVTIVLRAPATLGRINADRGQVEQVILNLVVNAQDAMAHGGELTLESANVQLDEAYTATNMDACVGPHVLLSVTDTGTGMTADVLRHLFEPFFTTKKPGQGTGLGLATVHRIATRNGGCVEVTSELGAGTAVKVYFPQAEPAETWPGSPPKAAAAPTGTETILVVEDSASLRQVTRRLLEKLGYTVLTAADAAEALRQFDEHDSIDLLLTDVVMPGPSGPELTRQLESRRPGLKVVYMSGYSDEAIVRHGVLTPGIAFLHKPFATETLGRKIRQTLDR